MSIEHFKPEPHASRSIAGTECCGCPCMHVISTAGRRVSGERYWCSRRHERVDPASVECGWRAAGGLR